MNTARTTLQLTVTGMTCRHCEQAVTHAVQQLDPNAQLTIQRSANTVQIHTTAAASDVCAAIAHEGYTAELAR